MEIYITDCKFIVISLGSCPACCELLHLVFFYWLIVNRKVRTEVYPRKEKPRAFNIHPAIQNLARKVRQSTFGCRERLSETLKFIASGNVNFGPGVTRRIGLKCAVFETLTNWNITASIIIKDITVTLLEAQTKFVSFWKLPEKWRAMTWKDEKGRGWQTSGWASCRFIIVSILLKPQKGFSETARGLIQFDM